jgi:hypothetical protein
VGIALLTVAIGAQAVRISEAEKLHTQFAMFEK